MYVVKRAKYGYTPIPFVLVYAMQRDDKMIPSNLFFSYLTQYDCVTFYQFLQSLRYSILKIQKCYLSYMIVADISFFAASHNKFPKVQFIQTLASTTCFICLFTYMSVVLLLLYGITRSICRI